MTCETGFVTTVNGTGGVTAMRTGNTINLGADIATLQSRVNGTCAAGQSIRAIAANGTVTCEPDDNTTYGVTANAGVALASGNFGLIQCAAGQVLKAGASPSTWACAVDVDTSTTYFALGGGGLSLNASNQFSVDGTVARKDTASGNQTFDNGTLFLDYTNNRIGVNDVSPTQAVDVNGTVQASSFLFRAPRTDAIAIAAVNFVPEPGSTTVQYTSSGYMYLASPVVGAAGLYAQVVLPDGVSITGLTCYQYDNSLNDITGSIASLRYRTSLALTSLEIAAANSPASGALSSIRTFTAPAFPAHTVNTDNQYFIAYNMVVTPAADANTRFYGCRVIYSTPGPI